MLRSDLNEATSGNGFSLAFSQNAEGDFKYCRVGCGEGKDSDITLTWTGSSVLYGNDHGQYSSKSGTLICGASNANPIRSIPPGVTILQ